MTDTNRIIMVTEIHPGDAYYDDSDTRIVGHYFRVESEEPSHAIGGWTQGWFVPISNNDFTPDKAVFFYAIKYKEATA